MAIDRVIIGTKLSVINTGETILTGTLELPVVTKAFADTGYTATVSDYTILCDVSGGSMILNLPTAASISGRIYNIKKITTDANTVTVTPNGAETIDGAATQVISFAYESLSVQSNGTNWYIL